MDRIDLHIHTTASDGTVAPEAIPELAVRSRLCAVAITDHDSFAGVHKAMKAGNDCGIDVIPGIEISVDYLGKEIHLLGYYIDTEAPAWVRVNEFASDAKRKRNFRMVEALQQLGFDISLTELYSSFPEITPGRPQIAMLLMKKGYINSVSQGFKQYLGPGGPAYFDRERIPFEFALDVIKKAGGVPVLAHPFEYYSDEKDVSLLLCSLKEKGLGFVEAYHSDATAEQRNFLLHTAAELGLGVTGGSDYHGDCKPTIAIGSGHGDLAVPAVWLEALKAAAKMSADD